jgi:hypothetical protein
VHARSSPGRSWHHLAALWAVALLQPLFDLLGRNPEFFAAHHAGRAEILILVAALAIAAPLALAALVWLAGLAGRRARAIVLGTIVGLLAAAIAMQAAKHAGFETARTALPIAAAAGIGLAIAYHAFSPVRAFLSILSVAALIVPAWFLARPQVWRLWAPHASEDVADDVARQGGKASETPVVLVVLDETPLVSLLDADQKIDPVLYPNLAALARDGLWFRNTTPVSDYTRWALPAILSGQQPRAKAAPDARDYRRTLFTMLARDYRFESVEAVTRLCPDRLCGPPVAALPARLGMIAGDLKILTLHLVLPEDMKQGLPKLTDDWANFGAAADAARRRRAAARRHRNRLRHLGAGDDLSQRASIARRFIAGISQEDPQPTLYFLHTMVSHTPYELLPGGRTNGTLAVSKALRFPNALPGTYKEPWPDDEWAVAQVYQRHLLQLEYCDALIGTLVRRLKHTGLYDRALVIVVADHGAVIEPGVPRRDYMPQTSADIARVPLIVKVPAHRPPPAVPTHVIDGQRISDVAAETIDVLPTIAEAIGMRTPSWTDGVSLFSPPPSRTRTIAVDSATRVVPLDAAAVDLERPLRRKLDLFGSSENHFRLPRPPRYGDLIGQPLASLRTTAGGDQVTVDYLSEFEGMNLDENPVPFDVGGRLERTAGNDPVYLAVAVNGIVRAITRTWQDDPQRWLATPPLTAWHDGKNDLRIFVVGNSAEGPVLRQCTIRAGREEG